MDRLEVYQEANVLPQPGPGELGTPDQIVFDENVWTPNCSHISEFASDLGKTLSGKEQKHAHFDMNECFAYEEHRRTQYEGLGHWGLRVKSDTTYFLHVSKSGGTFFCACGMSNHKNPGKEIDYVNNCHYLKEDWPWWGDSDSYVPGYAQVPKSHPNSWATYGMQLQKQNINLEGNENFLPDGTLSADFENVLVVRAPIHRLASHIAEILSGHWAKSHGHRPHMGSSDSASRLSLGEIIAKWPRLADNYLSRSLLGASAFQKEFGTLTETEFLIAAKTMREFDNIFVMDKDLAQEVEHHYQWSCKKVKGRKNSGAGGTSSIVKRWQENWPREDWEKLLEINRFDINLFNDAQIKGKYKSYKRYLERRLLSQ